MNFFTYNVVQLTAKSGGVPTAEKSQTLSGEFTLTDLAKRFPLSWSHVEKGLHPIAELHYN